MTVCIMQMHAQCRFIKTNNSPHYRQKLVTGLLQASVGETPAVGIAAICGVVPSPAEGTSPLDAPRPIPLDRSVTHFVPCTASRLPSPCSSGCDL